MFFSFLLTASVSVHAKPLHHHHKSKPVSRSRPSVKPLEAAAVIAIKADAQFLIIAPEARVRSEWPEAALPAGRHAMQSEEEHEAQALIAEVNAERTERSLAPLLTDPLLTEAADAHSREMCACRYFDHLSPSPALATPTARYLKTLREWNEDPPASAIIGENIFYSSVTNALYNIEYAHRRLMESPGHRANILDTRFTKIGVGVYRDSQGRFWVTEMFLRDEGSEPDQND